MLTTRADRAQNLIGCVSPLPNGNYQVRSETDPRKFYQVHVNGTDRCNCRDFTSRAVRFVKPEPCKHILATRHYVELHERPLTLVIAEVLQERREKLSELVKAYADQWTLILHRGEQFVLPVSVCEAFGTLDDKDCYRLSDMLIPEDEEVEVLRAIDVLESYYRGS